MKVPRTAVVLMAGAAIGGGGYEVIAPAAAEFVTHTYEQAADQSIVRPCAAHLGSTALRTTNPPAGTRTCLEDAGYVTYEGLMVGQEAGKGDAKTLLGANEVKEVFDVPSKNTYLAENLFSLKANQDQWEPFSNELQRRLRLLSIGAGGLVTLGGLLALRYIGDDSRRRKLQRFIQRSTS